MFRMRKVFMRLFLLLLACLLAAASSCVAEDYSPKEDFLTVGNVVTFGHYEQDADESNGAEPIEWIVLDVQDGKALLLSKYCLDAKPYNMEGADVTWETCTLRAWLNGDFLDAAFTGKEQAAILLTDVDNSKTQGYSGWDTDGGNNTQDKIFLLSWAEAEKYLETTRWDRENPHIVYPEAQTGATAYAVWQGAWPEEDHITPEGDAACWWWLRSPGEMQHLAARVAYGGALNFDYVDFEIGGVRPACWLDLESDIF